MIINLWLIIAEELDHCGLWTSIVVQDEAIEPDVG